MQAKSHLLPGRDGILEGNRLVVLVVRRKVLNGVGLWPLLRVAGLVGQDHGQ